MWFSLCLSVILLRSVSCVFTIKIGLDWIGYVLHTCEELVNVSDLKVKVNNVMTGQCYKHQ